MNKLYLITFKANQYFNAVHFHSYINDLYSKKWITDWWHYTDNAYIVASAYDVNRLYSATVPGMSTMTYVLFIEIDPNNAQGWLPTDAWKWLQKYKQS